MKSVFYGSAIQGSVERGKLAGISATLISLIRGKGFNVLYDHTTGRTIEETARLLEKSGELPALGTLERRIIVRNKMIEAVESGIAGAIFEVSIPSLGVGMEVAHAYLRPRMGLREIPILVLYKKDSWPNDLSTMIRGITKQELPNFTLMEYRNEEEAKKLVSEFLKLVDGRD